jgi:anti-sigma factor RsiW
MTHRRLRRRLHALLEGLLPTPEADVLRAHLAGCAACRGELRALEATEALVGRLPAALVPLGAGAEAEARLALLARWSPAAPARPAWGVGRLHAVGATLAAASLVLAVWLGPLDSLIPPAREPGGQVSVASLVSTALVPSFDASSGTPYTWR